MSEKVDGETITFYTTCRTVSPEVRMMAVELQERRASSPAAVDETDNVTPILKMHGRVMVNLPFERVPRSATDPGIGALPEDPLKECAMHVFAARKLHQLVVKYMAGSAQEALSSLGDDGEIHAAVHDALSGKCAQEWIDEQIRTSSPAAGRDAVIEECAKVAEALDRVGREWVPDSIWDKINRDAAKRIRALKETPNGN